MILLRGLGVGGPLVTGGMGFGFGISDEVPPPASQSGRGYFYPAPRRKSKEDIRAERIEYRILKEPKAVEAIQKVAAVVIASKESPGLEIQKDEQVELLMRMLNDEGFDLKTEQTLTRILNRVIVQEIERQEEERAIVQILFEM